MVAYIDTKRVIDSSTVPMFEEVSGLLATAPFLQAVSPPMPVVSPHMPLVSAHMAAGSNLTKHAENLGHATPFELRSKVNGRFMGGVRLCLSLCFGAPLPSLPLSPEMLPVTNKELRHLWELVGSAATNKKGSDSFTAMSRILLPWACSLLVVAGLAWAIVVWPVYTDIVFMSVFAPYLALSLFSILRIVNCDVGLYAERWDYRMYRVYHNMKTAGMSMSPCLAKVADISKFESERKESLSVLVLRTLGLDVSFRMSRLVTAMEAAYTEKLLEVVVDGEANELLCRVLECHQQAKTHNGTRVITG